MSEEYVIYVLELEGGYFYVGKTQKKRLNVRMCEHRNGGCMWTKVHRFENVIKVDQMRSIFDEDNTTKQYMMRYGVDNVRGGSYSSQYLPIFQKKALEVEFRSAENKCFTCGEHGHYSHNCSNDRRDTNIDRNDDNIVDSDAYPSAMYYVDSDVF